MSWFGLKKKQREDEIVKPQSKLVLSHNDMKAHVSSIIRQIQASNWKPDYVVGITRGGLYPAVMLSHYLDVPMYSLKVTLRDGVEEDCDTNCWMSEDAYGYPNREFDQCNILVVDDINDSGSTIAWIKKDWRGTCLPQSEHWENVWHKNVRFATVVNNLASSETVDYFGIEINKDEEDQWVEFPYENWWLK